MLGFTRPGALLGGLPLLVYAMAMKAALQRGARGRLALCSVVVAGLTIYAFFAALQTNRVTDETRHADVYESRDALKLPVSPLGGFAAERSFYRGDEPFWVEYERDAGRPACARFDRVARHPEITSHSVRADFERKDAAVRAAVHDCRALDKWWRDGGVSAAEALTDPSVWWRYVTGVSLEAWVPPVYHQDFDGWDGAADVAYGPFGLVGAVVLGLAVAWWSARRFFVDWAALGAVVSAGVGTLAFSVVTWYQTPLEPARHALPWTLLLPTVVALTLTLGYPSTTRREDEQPSVVR
jgi:hypothetical protein